MPSQDQKTQWWCGLLHLLQSVILRKLPSVAELFLLAELSCSLGWVSASLPGSLPPPPADLAPEDRPGPAGSTGGCEAVLLC